jgi:uncharacterized membrane protein
MELWRILAHNHWFTIWFMNREVRLCARCTGYVTGYLAAKSLHYLIGSGFSSLQSNLQIIICLLTLIPLAIDWLTQTWKWRKSNNTLRFITGNILGIGVFLYSLINLTNPLKALIFTSVAYTIALLGLISHIRLRTIKIGQDLY